GAYVAAAVEQEVAPRQPDREPVWRAPWNELALVLLRKGGELLRVAPVEGEQLLRAHHAEPVGGRPIALHLPLDSLVDLAVPNRVRREEHARHGGLFRGDAARGARQIQQAGGEALAAVIGE